MQSQPPTLLTRTERQRRKRKRLIFRATRPVRALLQRLGVSSPALWRFIITNKAQVHRTVLINHLIVTQQFKSYLEIGCAQNKTFDRIRANLKVGVDPLSGGTIRATSNAFFATNAQTFDLIFVDGSHHADQVLVDVENSLRVLNEGGMIVMHDCNPRSEARQRVPRVGTGPWNGDVWRAVVMLRTRADLDIAIGDFDQGCAVVCVRPNSDRLQLPSSMTSIDDFSYEALTHNRQDWLRLVDYETLKRFVAG